MKGIYFSNLDPVKAKGYEAKILGQIQGFNKLGVDMDLICLASDNRVLLKKSSATEAKIQEQTLSSFLNNLLLKRIALYKNTLKIIKQNAPDFLYLRHPRSDPLYLDFLKSVKRLHPKIVIISEIPTYPYDQEYINCNSIKDKLLIFLDKATRNKLKKYIDHIVVVAYEGNIFGIPSINITNGINTNSIKQISNVNSIDREIHLIGVGNLDFWHGYDRVILGLKEYYQKSNNSHQPIIIFNIVSPYRETVSKLQELTIDYNLSDYVIFHGAKHGQELDKLFERCHLAIGTIANHRIKLKHLSPLKAREYIARGIPFISSYEDSDFHANFPYILKVSATDEPINIQQVIDFTNKIYRNNDYSSKMREYATKNLDWSIKLKPILKLIENLRCLSR